MDDGDPEADPLLAPDESPPRTRFSPISLVIPIAMVCRLATRLPSTTTFRIIEQLLCRFYYSTNDPSQLPPSGRIPSHLCAVPEVKQWYASTMTILALSDGIGSIVAYTLLSFISSRTGRKPAILFVVAAGLVANVAIIAFKLGESQSLYLQAALMILWMLFNSFSQPLIMVFATNMYLVDLVEVEQRTATLSSLWGWSTLGSALSFAIGGTITTTSDKDLPVYFVSGTIWVVLFLYIILLLPESFPKYKRDQELAAATNSGGLGSLLEPLVQLLPRRDPEAGVKQWRLAICALHVLLVDLGGAYSITALIVYLTGVERYTPQEMGYVLTTLTFVGAAVLTLVVPRLVAVLRRRYSISGATAKSARDRVDIHLIFLAWCIDAMGFIVLGLVSGRVAQLGAVVVIGCGAPRAPILRSLVASSASSTAGVGAVDPLVQGQTLAAVEMVAGLGKLLSPLLMGGILSSSVSTMPTLVFYVQAAIVVSGASVLFAIKDV
uniref:Tetracycline-efflux n=1 Tax=Mycena chlorophos TaxID=658473 RepID=A0ABQ0LPX5_MYCCL|nr:tetracycline-efflux [Mycena chlorophos]